MFPQLFILSYFPPFFLPSFLLFFLSFVKMKTMCTFVLATKLQLWWMITKLDHSVSVYIWSLVKCLFVCCVISERHHAMPLQLGQLQSGTHNPVLSRVFLPEILNISHALIHDSKLGFRFRDKVNTKEMATLNKQV